MNIAQGAVDIDKWSNRELLELFGVPKTDTQLDEASKKLIGKALKAGKKELASFLTRAAEKLRLDTRLIMNDPDFREQVNPQALQAIANEQTPSSEPAVKVTGTDRKNNKLVLDKSTGVVRPTQVSENLGQQTVYASKYQQGNINQRLVQSYKRVILLDSRFRVNPFPYKEQAVYGPSSATSYHANLTESLRNTTSLKLQSVSIPRVWDNISCALGNSVIGLLKSSDLADYIANRNADKLQGSISWYIAPDGHYTSRALTGGLNLNRLAGGGEGMPETLNAKYVNISTQTTITSGRPFIAVTSSGVFSSKQQSTTEYAGYRIELRASQEENIEFELGDYRIVLFADEMPTCAVAQGSCYPSSSVTKNLGTTFGFLPVKPSDILKLPDGSSIILASGTAADHAIVPPDLIGITYFIIVVDDFNNSRINSSLVSVADANTKIVPGKAGQRRLGTNGSCEFAATEPRAKTRNQLYADNQKLSSLYEPEVSSIAPCLSNTISLCPVTRGNYGDVLTLTGTAVNSVERTYFGPVSLEKMKVSLHDESGRIVDLKGHNWSITLVAEQLYQY